MPTNVSKEYCTVQARIPLTLFERVQRYGQMHRYNVSALIREGLEMRVEADVPGRTLPQSLATEEEVLPEVLQTALRATVTEVLHEVLPHYARQQQAGIAKVIYEVLPHYARKQQKGLTEVLHEVLPRYMQPQSTPQEGITEVLHREDAPRYTRQPPAPRQGMTEVLPHETPPAVPLDGAPGYALGSTQGQAEGQGMTEVLPSTPPQQRPRRATRQAAQAQEKPS